MAERICSIPDCDRPFKARGWCVYHYSRWHQTGSPTTPLKFHPRAYPTAPPGFWDQVSKTPACWLWQGKTIKGGHGIVRFDGQPWLAHRIAYVTLVGPVEPGLHIHHTCENPPCVNPDHMQVLTAAEHRKRHPEFSSRKGRKARRCRGAQHPLDGPDAKVLITASGQKICLRCWPAGKAHLSA